MSGQKFDGEKPRYDLIPPEVEEALAVVLTHGASKYGDNNWMDGISFRRIFAATRRHLRDYRKGEYIDKDSGLPHLHLAFAELAFLIYYETYPEKYESFNTFKEEWRLRNNE